MATLLVRVGLGWILAAALPIAGARAVQDMRAQNVYPAWNPGTPYREGDLVSYLGVTYVCLRAHTSRAGQEPPAAPDLWRVFNQEAPSAPAPPRGLAAVADGPTHIVVSWSLVEGATTYDLQVDGQAVTGVASPYLHKGLAPASTHVYRVRACNDAGAGSWSDAVPCATEAAPAGRAARGR
jgi:chitinase